MPIWTPATRIPSTRIGSPPIRSWKAASADSTSLLRKLERANGKLRERVFKRVLGQAGDDIAGYISDDFGLMFDALAMDDLEASWVFGLYECYASATLPSGSIHARPRPVLK